MKKTLKCIGLFLLIFALVSCGSLTGDPNQETETHEPLFADGIENVQSISLCYMGYREAAITITDKETITALMGFVTAANGTKGESTMGHYGVSYSLQIYTEASEPLIFWLWDEERYSLGTYEDEEGYPYFWMADMSEMYDYLEGKYPADFWRSALSAGGHRGGGRLEQRRFSGGIFPAGG